MQPKLRLLLMTAVIMMTSFVNLYSQNLFESFSDGNFTSNPVWGGNVSDWNIVSNSDVSTGATGSNTLRLSVSSGSGTKYLSSQISSWGDGQEWGFWIGRRGQAYTLENQLHIWLYANEADLTSSTVDGYRISIGDNTGGDELRLEYIVNGAVSATVITSSGSIPNTLEDIGFLLRITRSNTGVWNLYTSTLPTASSTGAIATDIPNAASTTVNQGTATNNSLVPSSNGYLGFDALHTTGGPARATVEIDQIYFTTCTASTFYLDNDGDGFGNPAITVSDCTAPEGYVNNNTDCDDDNVNIHPGATETCNGIDDDCDGIIDEGVTTTYYEDNDHDGYGNPAASIQACSAPEGYVTNNTDCDDASAAVHPGATEVCNGIDDDCDGFIDEGVKTTFYEDADGDGFGNPLSTTQACTAPAGYVTNSDDCDDVHGDINPNTVWYLDADGDGYYTSSQVSCTSPGVGYTRTVIASGDCAPADNTKWQSALLYIDADGDNYDAGQETVCYGATYPSTYKQNTLGTDCDDENGAVHPGATEICNGIDDNCDGSIDEGVKTTFYRDADGDGYGNPSVTTQACTVPAGYVVNSGDCNDASAAVHPGATEVCNGIDDDCDGSIDEGVKTTFYQDLDGDGYGNPSVTTQACTVPAGYVANSNDCDDTDEDINPNTVWYLDADGDGYYTSTQVSCTSPGVGYTRTVTASGDCAPADNTKWQSALLYIDADGDNYDAGQETVCYGATYPSTYKQNTLGTDCDDENGAVHPGATEICNGIDDNCDGSIDEGVKTTFYRDADGDGYGNPSVTTQACTVPAGYVVNSGDCNDASAAVHPGATEVCNGIDDDCDGSIDEGVKTTFYQDLDGDGYGNPSVTTQACTVPAGYVANSNDCDDTDEDLNPNTVWYLDADGDGFAVSTTVGCNNPGAGYTLTVLPLTDCNDNLVTYEDNDGDGFGTTVKVACNGVTNSNDCDDTDEDINPNTIWYLDADGDGYYTSSQVSCTSPGLGYTRTVTASGDCAPADETKWQSALLYIDADGDNYDAGQTTVCYGVSYPAMYKQNTLGTDCNDNNIAVNPAAIEVCNGIDDDCDGTIDDGFINTQVNCAQTGTVTKNLASGCTYTATGTEFDATVFQNCGPLGYTLTGATTGTGTLLAGVQFNTGTTTVTWSATNASGQVISCSFDVYVVPAAPVITCPSNVSVNADPGQCGAVVNYTAPALPQLCTNVNTLPVIQPSVTQTAGLSSGSEFPVGTTTNTFLITDAFGQTSTCSFNVTVTDNQSPTIVQPENITVGNTAGQCTATVSYGGASASDNCGITSLRYFLNYTQQTPVEITFPRTFAVGSYLVTVEAKDAANHVTTKTFTVTVNDTEQPQISAISGISSCFYDVNSAKAAAIAAVEYSDNCTPNNQIIVSAEVQGSCSALVTVYVTDGSGNTNSVSFNTKVDNTAPVFTGLPSSATLTVNCHEVPNAPTVTANDNCDGARTVTYTPSSTKGSDPSQSDYYNYTITRKWEVWDGCNNYNSFTQTITVQDVTAPVITCPANFLSVPFDFGQLYATIDKGTATATDNCAPVANISITNNDAITNQQYPAGTTNIQWKAKDPSNRESSCTQTITVRKRNTVLTYTGSQTENKICVQYSDTIELSALLTDDEGLQTANVISGRTVIFQLLNGSTVLRFKTATTDADGIARDTFKLDEAPGINYSIKTIFAGDDYFNGDTDQDAMHVKQENALLAYIGSQYFTTPSATSYNADVIFTTSVTDTTDGNLQKGDIRNALINFRQGSGFSTSTIIPGASNVPVGLVYPGTTNLQEGLASFTYNYTLQGNEQNSSGKTWEIWTEVNNYYKGQSDQVTLVTLALPGTENISGGGNLVITNSAGMYAATAQSKMNFGFTMRWNKSGKNLQGQINIVFRRWELFQGVMQWRTYQIKSNAVNSMNVQQDAGYSKGTINTKATLNDITDPLNVISYGGNHALMMRAWDHNTTTGGSMDQIAVSLINSSNNLLFASSWSSNALQIQTITGGNINVKNNNSANTTAPPTSPKAATVPVTENTASELKLELQAHPNPAGSYFNVRVQTSNKETGMVLRVTDISGRVIETMSGLHGDQVLRIGQAYLSGVYIVEVVQGDKRKQLKIVKL